MAAAVQWLQLEAGQRAQGGRSGQNQGDRGSLSNEGLLRAERMARLEGT